MVLRQKGSDNLSHPDLPLPNPENSRKYVLASVAHTTTTDADGRLRDWPAAKAVPAGTYRLIFDTRAYFASRKIQSLYPQVVIVFEVRDAQEHYHIPLLLSPFGYSTYRGS